MQSRSTLARLQQAVTLSLFSCALAWLAWHWRTSPLLALSGFLGIIFSYSMVLAVELMVVGVVNRADPAPAPAWAELVRAWLGETATVPWVFFWRQPFRWLEVPDQLGATAPVSGRRGVVFIHGLVCNRGFWTPWLKQLRAHGHCFVAVNLEPVFGSIDEYVSTVELAVQQVTQATGLPPVLICHSMGGLAARAWLGRMSGNGRVHHIITIGSPHQGTWLGQLSWLKNGRQMRLHSDWLRELEAIDDRRDYSGFTCWYSNCDNVVFPASTATLPGAQNRLVRGTAHVELAFDRRVMSESWTQITAR